MAARYALQSFWWHNTVTNRDEYVGLGFQRDTTHQAVVQRPEMFATTPLDTSTGLSPGRNEYLKIHPSGPGDA
jgi:hypothetical protein